MFGCLHDTRFCGFPYGVGLCNQGPKVQTSWQQSYLWLFFLLIGNSILVPLFVHMVP